MPHANSETREPLRAFRATFSKHRPRRLTHPNCRRLPPQKKRKAHRGNYQTLINDALQDYLRRPSIAQQVGAAVRAVLREELGKVKVVLEFNMSVGSRLAVSQFTRNRADSSRATCRGLEAFCSRGRPHSSLGALTPSEFAQLKSQRLIPPPAGENDNSSPLRGGSCPTSHIRLHL
jgi:hypothetical protein